MQISRKPLTSPEKFETATAESNNQTALRRAGRGIVLGRFAQNQIVFFILPERANRHKRESARARKSKEDL